MLLLAGITINALSGSDSAPAKANEAEQQNDIGTAKDQISLTAVNAKTEAYDAAYVGNGISSLEASNSVGRAVIKAVTEQINAKNQYGKAIVEITGYGTIADINNDATIAISTRDFELTGTITLKDGIVIWGKIENNVPRISDVPETLNLDTGSNYTINAKLKGTTGTINWNSNKPSIASVSNGVITTATNITNPTEQVTITASADGCEIKTCILTVTKAMPYAKDVLVLTNNTSPYVYYTDKNGKKILCRVLYNDVDGDNTHGLQIITADILETVSIGTNDEKYKNETTLSNLQKIQNSYNNVIENLNNKAENYNNNLLSYDARCVGSIATTINNRFDNKNHEELLTNTNNYSYLEEYVNQGYKGKDNNYQEDYESMGILGIRKAGFYYWLASRFAYIDTGYTSFSVRHVESVYGSSNGSQLFTTSDSPNVEKSYNFGLRPVFLLKSNVKISGGQGTSASPYELFAE